MVYHFIVNPVAGGGAARRLYPIIKKYMENSGLPYQLYVTTGVNDAQKYARREAQKGDEVRFFVCGGDGTLHEVINGILEFSNASVGLFPAGSGNDFSRNFVGRELFFDIESQIFGEVHQIDVLQANQKIAVNMVNIGFDCEVVMEAANWKKKAKGALAYFMGVLVVFARPMGKSMEITLEDGRVIDGEFLLCSIANGSFCGGGFQSSPHARLNDGLMDIGVVRKFSRFKLIGLLPHYRTGTYLERMKGNPNIQYFQTKGVRICAKQPLFASVDGEIVSFEDLKIQMGDKVGFIVPRGVEMARKPPMDECFAYGK